MKTTRITIFLFLFVLKVCAQNNPFFTDKKKDSLWVQQLIEIEKGKQLDALKKDSNVVKFDWMNGKVVYSPDSCLRIGQVSIRYDVLNSTTYATTAQYSQQNRILELKLPTDTDNYDFQDFPVTNIYKLPDPQGTYLILSAQVQKQADQISDPGNNFPSKYPSGEEFKKIEKMYRAASLVRIAGDSLKEVEFKTEADESNNQTHDIISGNSLYLKSRIQNTKYSLKPFLKYDPTKKELSFLTTYYDTDDTGTNSNVPYINVYSGTFKYCDTVFTLISDTGYFYPSLKSLNKTIATKKFKTGKYTTKATATVKYEEVGEGVLPVLYVNCNIQSQNIGYMNYMYNPEQKNIDLKPDYKAQKNSSLIFLVTDSTTPNHSGMCGGADYEDSEFWLITQNNKKKLFSFSSSSCNSYTTYFYNDGKSNKEGKFYLKSNSDTDKKEMNLSVDTAYWKNNDTYVFHVGDETLSRNFYVHFVTINKKTIAKLIVGKLEHKKGG